MVNNKIKTFEEGLEKITDDLKKLMIRKQNDYGHENIMASGEVGIIVRMTDKLARLRNLYDITDKSFIKKIPKNESLKDSFQDIANYAIIALMLRRGVFTLPLKKEKSNVKNKKSN